ncbi:unnamed protein product [Effrenium voratum]|uniref:Bidirectional sugar transporter SWEET n=1 Tax=Effrenium voratum TaxID=2562239 RepID=A0AA36MKL3_9DINO|nr:unnamed protein product [Effrenium voratum]
MVFTMVYFLSPVPTILKIAKAKDVQEFAATPCVMGVFNCSIWTYYCVVTMEATSQNLTPNLLVNGLGAIMWLGYVAVFMAYAGKRCRPIVNLFLITMVIEALLIAFFEGVAPKLNWSFHWGDLPLKCSLSGLLCDIVNVLLYGSPLVTMGTVIRTKSVEFMPLPMSVLTFVISVLWSAQAVLIDNIAVLIPNALGILLGAAQLVLYAIYCRPPEEARDVMLA